MIVNYGIKNKPKVSSDDRHSHANSWWHPVSLFEFSGHDRLLAMEGLRGVAVGLVFLQHYCASFINLTDLDGPAFLVAGAFLHFGNYGVELFFVMSGFLIYGMLLKKRPDFFSFMNRRAVRLYPAFLVALAIGILLDPMRPMPRIPGDGLDAALYLGANVAFLPGLLPIEPLFTVNWSLSYEWWFYVVCTLLIGSFGLARFPRAIRIVGIFSLGGLLVGSAAIDLPHVPIRGLCLLAGMLLTEAVAIGTSGYKVTSKLAFAVLASTFCLLVSVSVPVWLNALILAMAFYLLAAAAFNEHSAVAALLRFRPLRWLGNMSYSFYLIHGLVVVAFSQVFLSGGTSLSVTALFWGGLLPTFGLCSIAGATLFLVVEKPFSLQRKQKRSSTAAIATFDQAQR